MTVRRTTLLLGFLQQIDRQQTTFEKLLFQLRLSNFDLYGFVDLLSVTAPMVCIILDGS